MSAPVVQPPGTVETLETTADYTITRTWGPAGSYDVACAYNAGTVGANAQTLNDQVRAALERLRQIQTQATTFVAQGPYSFSTLAAGQAAVNDLLSKAQLIAAAVNDIATDLIGIARIMSGQYDATT